MEEETLEYMQLKPSGRAAQRSELDSALPRWVWLMFKRPPVCLSNHCGVDALSVFRMKPGSQVFSTYSERYLQELVWKACHAGGQVPMPVLEGGSLSQRQGLRLLVPGL